jgi:hypothetical protein
MAELSGGDWRAFGPSGPSAADLFNPADFEARLSEARARRRKALAEREGNREAISPGLPPSTLPAAAGWDRWGFLAGILAGATAALIVHQISSASLPPPLAGGTPLAPAAPEAPVPISFSRGIDAYAPQARLTVLENVLPEASPAAPEAWQVKVAALVSKLRLAGPPPPVRLRMPRAPIRSISRAALFQGGGADGRDTGGARIMALARAFDSAMDPVTSGRAVGQRPRAINPPSAEPRPSTLPDRARPASGRTQRSRDSSPGRPEGQQSATRDRRDAVPGRETAGRPSHDRGARDHAQGSGRGAGSGPGSRNESHGSGRGSGKSDDSRSGSGNGHGGKGGNGGNSGGGNGGNSGGGKGGNGGNGGNGGGKGRG